MGNNTGGNGWHGEDWDAGPGREASGDVPDPGQQQHDFGYHGSGSNPWADEPTRPAPPAVSPAPPPGPQDGYPGHGPQGPPTQEHEVFAPQDRSSRALPALVAAVTAVVVVAGAVVAISILGDRAGADKTQAAVSTQTASAGESAGPTGDPTGEGSTDHEVPVTGGGQDGSTGSSSSRPTGTRSSGSSSTSSTSDAPMDDDGAGPAVTDSVQSQDSAQVRDTLDRHGSAINTAAYEDGWALLTSGMQDRAGGFSQWKAGVESSTWQSVRIRDVSRDGSTGTAKVTLQTAQSPDKGHGHSCLVWDLTYTFDASGSTWLIDKASGDWSPC